MPTEKRINIVNEVIEGVNLSLDGISQSLSACPRPGQKATRGNASKVQCKELKKVYSTLLDVQCMLQSHLRQLQPEDVPGGPQSISTWWCISHPGHQQAHEACA